MKGETQALHLAKMMHKHLHYPQYELALPFVRVRSSKFKKLSVNDVLLLDLNVLKFILIEGDRVCADLVLQQVEDNYFIAVTQLHQKSILPSDSHKFETIKLSFGECKMKSFEVGVRLDVAQFDLGNIMLIVNDKKIAQGALINVDNEVAVKINTLF